MRWKWLLLVSLVAAAIGCAAWCLFVILLIGQLGILSSREGYVFGSLLTLFAISALAAFFVYRRTARRRRTQALLAFVLTLLLTFTGCFALGRTFRRQLVNVMPGQWFAG
jgi:hypothetical protein